MTLARYPATGIREMFLVRLDIQIQFSNGTQPFWQSGNAAELKETPSSPPNTNVEFNIRPACFRSRGLSIREGEMLLETVHERAVGSPEIVEKTGPYL